jgi:hypothetical protein
MAHISLRFLLCPTFAVLCACAGGSEMVEAATVDTLGPAIDDGAESTSGEDPASPREDDVSESTDDGGPWEDTTTGSAAQHDDSTGTGDPTEDDGSTDSADSADSNDSTSTGDEPTPAQVDLSLWTVVQTASDGSFVLPHDTLVPAGGWVVIGRAADQAAFETFWGVVLGDEVVYIDASDEFPRINGDETFSLLDAHDIAVDGPSPALTAGHNLQRTNAMGFGSSIDAWAVSSNPNAHATPGTSPDLQAPDVAYISEVSDVLGAGLYIYEFVEVHVPGPGGS